MELSQLESSLFSWITAEVKSKLEEEQAPVVPVHLLLVRLSMENREEDDELSQSTVLSLDTFEREQLYGALRRLEQKELIRFVDEAGNEPIASKGGFGAKFSEQQGQVDFVTLA